MNASILSAEALERSLSIRDLTDPAAGPHALQLLVSSVAEALRGTWRCDVRVHRARPIVPIEDNYDRLHYPADGAARDARYTRYVDETHVLRTQTSAMIPALLKSLASAPPEVRGAARTGARGGGVGGSPPIVKDLLLSCPGLVYRRDVIDRLHTSEPHQLDLWRIREGAPLERADLLVMIDAVTRSLLPGLPARSIEASHPYTVGGLQIDVLAAGAWVEIGECGVALPALLAEEGLDPARWSGLAMGLGLDRILMLKKGLDDIRLLRSTDERVAAQMLDLSPYRPVSRQPPIRRDLSIAVASADTPEELGDRVRVALGDRATSVEAIEVLSETPGDALPKAAALRIGLGPGQKNVLLRIVLRDLDRTLTHPEANALRDHIYAALHQGSVHQWASSAKRV
jgi:phenylalanyl-tRNA synthetase alpha chain